MSRPANEGQATLKDYITGRTIPDVGAEANRQAVARFLVERHGYAKSDIEIDVPIEMEIAGEHYRSFIDLAVKVDEQYMIVIKCAAGSLGSRDREVLAAARLLTGYQVPWSVVSDGQTALVFDTLTGNKQGEGLSAIPSRQGLAAYAQAHPLKPLAPERRQREQLIFRSYDSMNVNVIRPK